MTKNKIDPREDAAAPVAPSAETPSPSISPSATELGAPSALGADEWPPIDTAFLAPPTAPAPPFPINVIHANLRGLITGFAEARNLSVDYVAGAIFAACSGAIGNRARILTDDGNAQPVTVFVGLIGAASTGKSNAITIVEKILYDLDQEMQRAHDAIVGHASQSSIDKFDKKLHDIVARRLHLDGGQYDFDQTADGRNIDPPGLILSETTGARLLDELRTGVDGRVLISHEITGAMAYGAAYQGLRSRALILESYDGKARILRNKTDGKVIIPALVLTVLGATQPTRLRDLLGDAHDGLAARMWWIYPDVSPFTHLPTDPGPVAELRATLTRLLAIPPQAAPGAYSTLVPLSLETRAPLETAARNWAKILPLTDGLYRDVAGRAIQHAMRLAGLLAFAEHAAQGRDGVPDQVSVSDVRAAITIIAEYLMPMAERTLGVARGPGLTDAMLLARFLARSGAKTINIRSDVLRAAGSPVRDAERVAAAILELRHRGFVRPVARTAQRGRPAQDFEVNPHLLKLVADE